MKKNEQLEQLLLEALQSRKPTNEIDKSKAIDWLFKSLIAIVVWVVVGLRNDVDFVKTEVSKIATEKQYSERDMQDFREFIAKPRFTKEDFNIAIEPLVKQVNQNTLELNTRGSTLGDIENRLIKLEYKYDEVIKKIN